MQTNTFQITACGLHNDYSQKNASPSRSPASHLHLALLGRVVRVPWGGELHPTLVLRPWSSVLLFHSRLPLLQLDLERERATVKPQIKCLGHTTAQQPQNSNKNIQRVPVLCLGR